MVSGVVMEKDTAVWQNMCTRNVCLRNGEREWSPRGDGEMIGWIEYERKKGFIPTKA